jgi:Protein of unknown function (DUF3341)
MAGKNTAAFGIYPTRDQAERAVDQLIAAGFSQQDVSVLMADKQGSRDFAAEKNTKAPEGTTAGAVTGGAVGGTLGLLAGIGALAIPGVGPLIAAGPIMGALAGLGVGGTVGGLVGMLVGMGIPEYEAKRYEGRVKDGGILVSVHCDSSNEISRAKDVLKATGADDISSSGEKSVSTHTMGSDKERRVEREDVVVNRTTPGTPAGTTRTYDETVDEPTTTPVRPRDV